MQLVEGPRPSPGRGGSRSVGLQQGQGASPRTPQQALEGGGWGASLAGPSPGREQSIRPQGD